MSRNESRFAKHYVQANRWMMDAISEPTKNTFAASLGQAMLARSHAFDSPLERELGDKLILTIRIVAERHGFKIQDDGKVREVKKVTA